MERVIIKKARELFFTYGLKSVSMDDLARGAGVSKKTIYQQVADKNKLVQKVVGELEQCHADALHQCQLQASNAVHEVLLQLQLPFATMASVSTGFFYELEKFFPQSWNKMMIHKQKVMVPAIVQNMQRGMSEDNYRPNLDVALLADIRVQQLSSALNPTGFTSKKPTAKS